MILFFLSPAIFFDFFLSDSDGSESSTPDTQHTHQTQFHPNEVALNRLCAKHYILVLNARALIPEGKTCFCHKKTLMMMLRCNTISPHTHDSTSNKKIMNFHWIENGIEGILVKHWTQRSDFSVETSERHSIPTSNGRTNVMTVGRLHFTHIRHTWRPIWTWSHHNYCLVSDISSHPTQTDWERLTTHC